MAKPLTYEDAGVDIEAGDALIEQIKTAVKRTHGPRVPDQYGHFAGVFSLDYNERIFKRNYRHPLLVAGTDGVGTKLRVAIDAGRYRTVGQDCVAMCVNDILTLGAEPLFFLDYLGTGRLESGTLADVVVGVAEACEACDCALLGGETAELPGFYAPKDFDLAGFAVGIVEKKRIIDGSRIVAGDAVLGLASSGLHSNGYSLVRKIVFETAGLGVGDEIPGLGVRVADELLKPTRLYPRPVLRVLNHYERKRVVHGMAHITGGGIPGNVPRVIPEGLHAEIRKDTWPVPPIFGWLQKTGNVAAKEMWRVFNMGIGFVLIVSPYYADHIAAMLEKGGETVHRIGRIARGTGGVVLK
ncbi:MAG TPA: phosphoribosylformylglycinamidine cyclo-ligase [Phycisphaerae bacterium]|nr:phosphoribosylformylglycinamidine cyclo-ligase [Phycisphaerae bacterium]